MATPRVLWTQFPNIRSNELAQFRNPYGQVVLLPKEFRAETINYPYSSR